MRDMVLVPPLLPSTAGVSALLSLSDLTNTRCLGDTLGCWGLMRRGKGVLHWLSCWRPQPPQKQLNQRMLLYLDSRCSFAWREQPVHDCPGIFPNSSVNVVLSAKAPSHTENVRKRLLRKKSSSPLPPKMLPARVWCHFETEVPRG